MHITLERPDASTALDGERKTVTALFADIKGSMELMEDLDPEEARAIVDPALRLMIDAVHRYDGYIVQSTGDGVFALFGAPVAHEDHPQRALYAALRMQEDLKRYSDRLRKEGRLPLQARVGVNTGEVVVRSIKTSEGHAEYTPIGHSTGLAARMQALAPIGSIATTQQTRKLCEGFFAFKPLGPTTVRGVSEPVVVFEVTGLGPLRTRLQVAERRGLTKFVGRQTELEQTKHALELARSGRGQIVAAMGEPGVGKSRLFFEFKAVAQSGCLVLAAYSVSHGKASAYLPVTELLKNYFEIASEDDERKRREKIAGKIVMLDRSLEDTLPYLFALQGVVEGDDPLAQLDPQVRRRRTLEAIKRILVRESLNQPLIVEFEDLHWIDSETQSLLNLLVDGLATAPILLLVNYRPEYLHQWSNKTYYTQLRLDPLGKENADEMLSALLASPAPAGASADADRERPTVRVSRSPERSEGEAEDGRVRADDGIEALKGLIIERTEGNPFFMEEMVQALFEQGLLIRNGAVKLAKPLDQIRVPATVQAILTSRIDRLAAVAKELLQTLAVLGREFPLSLIKRVAGKSEDELAPILSALQLGEFIYEQPAFPDIEYTFKHALTQEVTYNSLLIERRRWLHERAARAIEALYADWLEDHLAELAHHYDRSGNLRKAVEYLGRAGQRAARQSAHSEAVGFLIKALDLLKQLPDGVNRARQELDLQMALRWSLFVRSPGSPEREPVLIRAQELCQQIGDNARLMEVLIALGLFLVTRREYEPARIQGQRVLVLAEEAQAPAMLARANSLIGTTLTAAGRFELARQHFEAAESFGVGSFLYAGQGGTLAYVLFLLGYPEVALRRSVELLATARQSSDPVSIAVAFIAVLRVHCELADGRAGLERAEEMLAMTMEHGMPFFKNVATFFRGWALAISGRAKEGIADVLRAIAMAKDLGGPISYRYAALADAYAREGQSEEGLKAVVEGLAWVEQVGERSTESELLRLKGELLLMRDAAETAQAEQCFRAAIDVADRQAAKWFELLATTSLARLLKRQGKGDEARKLLAEVYGWFTEGFEFAGLKEAKALLVEIDA